jgi:hypothetical protein
MTTIILKDKEILIDDSLLEKIPYFNSILGGSFLESSSKRVQLDFSSSEFLKLLQEVISSNTDHVTDSNYYELCNYLQYDTKLETYSDIDFEYDRGFIDKNTYIIKLILQYDEKIYFSNNNHFDEFYENPFQKNFYKTKNNDKNCEILSFLIFKKYNLMEYAIQEKLFHKININQELTFCLNNGYYMKNSLLTMSCMISSSYSSDEIARSLLYHNNIILDDDIKSNILGKTLNEYKLCSSYETIMMLMDYPNKDLINVSSKLNKSPLMYLITTKINNEKDEALKILLNHPKTDINFKNGYGQTALHVSLEHSSENITNMILEIDGVDMNGMTRGNERPLDIALKKYNINAINILFTNDHVKNYIINNENYRVNLINICLKKIKNDNLLLLLLNHYYNLGLREKSTIIDAFFTLYNSYKMINAIIKSPYIDVSNDVETLMLILRCINSSREEDNYLEVLDTLLKRTDFSIENFHIEYKINIYRFITSNKKIRAVFNKYYTFKYWWFCCCSGITYKKR